MTCSNNKIYYATFIERAGNDYNDIIYFDVFTDDNLA